VTYYIKFNAYLVHKKRITIDQFSSIIFQYDFTELSALLIKNFITNKISSREELMKHMNNVVKEHFNHLLREDFKDNTFESIFSIHTLVKWCDGRKTFRNVKQWNSGQLSRLYTQSTPMIYTGKIENYYCEGRLWKKQVFYDSETNKPLNEQHDVYWCRNKICVGVNNNVELDEQFDKWTLVELNEIFVFKLDRLAFSYVAGWINKMQEIFEKLKCRECNCH
jgi:hypothetical protein